MEQFVRVNPHREAAWASLMRGLYLTGRQVEATRAYDDYRRKLANDLGLEPTPGQQLFDLIIRGESLAQTAQLPPLGLAALSIGYQRLTDGRKLAVGTVGTGPTVLGIPQWISRLDMTAAGHDMRASVWNRLARHVRLVLDDRWATGLSHGELTDTSLESAITEAEEVAEREAGPIALFAMSGAGPIALGLAARRPDLVSGLGLWGTFASPRGVFNLSAKEGILAMARADWGLGSRTMAESTGPVHPPRQPRFGRAISGPRPRKTWLLPISRPSTNTTSPIRCTSSRHRRSSCTTARTGWSPSPEPSSWLPASPTPASSLWKETATCPTLTTSKSQSEPSKHSCLNTREGSNRTKGHKPRPSRLLVRPAVGSSQESAKKGPSVAAS